jgi:surface antigen
MLFRDRSRTATKQPYSITPPSQTGGLVQEMPLGLEPVTGANLTAFVPGEEQTSLVPSPLDGVMMPGTMSNLPLTQPLRTPVLIPATGKKSTRTMLAPQGRRVVINIGMSVVLVAVILGALIAVLPVGNGEASGLAKIFNPSLSMVTSKQNSTALIAAQAATATAVTQDGFDAGNQTYAGVTTSSTTSTLSPSDAGSLDRFFYGQCTYWANMRYHQLTGHWVPWLGNAGDWAYQASAYGWVTSGVPNPNGPSIIVLAPGTQGAGAYGHVAVVETGVTNYANGVLTSDWNWTGNGGGWATESWVTFYPGAGVTFVWF